MKKEQLLKEQLLEMEICYWKSVAKMFLKPKEVEKYEDALQKQKDKLLATSI